MSRGFSEELSPAATAAAPATARLILGSHDLALNAPSGIGAERDYWMDPGDYFGLIEFVEELAQERGYVVQLTSDDGFASDYDVYLPYLLDRGRTATFFVNALFVGQPNRISASQICEMADLGMSIGCHGMDHLRWSELDEKALRVEIVDAKHRIEDMLGAEITRVAPPFGAYNAASVRMCKKAGFKEIYTCRGGFSLAAGHLRPRVSVNATPERQTYLRELAKRGPGSSDRFSYLARELQSLVA